MPRSGTAAAVRTGAQAAVGAGAPAAVGTGAHAAVGSGAAVGTGATVAGGTGAPAAVGADTPFAPATRTIARLLAAFGLIVLFAAWFIWFRPQILGGPAAYVLVGGTSMEPHVEPGTLVVLVHSDTYAVGDVVAYRIPAGDPAAGRNVIHRIVGGDATTGFLMQGDNTNATDIWRPRPDDMIGREWLVLPDLATAMLFLRSPAIVAAVAAAIASYVVLGALSPRSGPDGSTAG